MAKKQQKKQKNKKDPKKVLAQADQKHYINTEKYVAQVGKLMEQAMADLSLLASKVDALPNKPFSFDQNKAVADDVAKTIQTLSDRITAAVERGSRKEWIAACAKSDEFIGTIMNKSKLTKGTLQSYQDRNLAALAAFTQREVDGMDLSRRVWKYVAPLKDEVEMAVDVTKFFKNGINSGKTQTKMERAIGTGMSAAELSREVRSCLLEPNKLFRRVKDKNGNLQLSKAAKLYHPGRGVYRSSYKNAMRLTRSEINMAYRQSDHLRWQQLDFVVGMKVELSNNHTTKDPHSKGVLPLYDVCDELAGNYPKDFKFVGWHPQCRCHATPILRPLEEVDKGVVDDEGNWHSLPSASEVTDVPQGFKDYMQKNEERIAGWSSEPYYIRDNKQWVDKALHPDKYLVKPLVLDEGTQTQFSKMEMWGYNHQGDDRFNQALNDAKAAMAKGKREEFDALMARMQGMQEAHGSELPRVTTPIEEKDTGFSFVPANTIEEAEKFAMQFVDSSATWTSFKGKVNYSGLSLEVANEINENLARVFDGNKLSKLPGIKVVKGSSATGKKIFSGADAIMATDPATGGIYLNVEKLKSQKLIEESRKESRDAFEYLKKNYNRLTNTQKAIVDRYIESGRSLVDDSVGGFISHELGHKIMRKDMPTKLINEVAKDRSKFDLKLSGYASSSPSEYFAESFSAYMRGYGNKIDQRLKEYFDGLGVVPRTSAPRRSKEEIFAAARERQIKRTQEQKDAIQASWNRRRAKVYGWDHRLETADKYISEYGLDRTMYDAFMTGNQGGDKISYMLKIFDLSDNYRALKNKFENEARTKMTSLSDVIAKMSSAGGAKAKNTANELQQYLDQAKKRKDKFVYANSKEFEDKIAAAQNELDAIKKRRETVKMAWKEREKRMSSKTMTDKLGGVCDDCEKNKIKALNVEKLQKPLDDKEIIARLAGGDKTQGSCSSLAFSFAANKGGLDVLDFRDGDSRKFFATNYNIREITRQVGGKVIEEYSDIKGVHEAMSYMVVGKYYYMATGRHAAIIRKTAAGGYEYLELQSSRENGFKELTDKTLAWRFSAKRSHSTYGYKYKATTELIDIDLLNNDANFRKLMSYINTKVGEQKKGASGTIK